VTRDPEVRTIRDFTPADKIALPGARASSQAIMLQMAAERAFGPGQEHRLDALTVSRGHPDAMAALLSKGTEITAHFSAPPFQDRELAVPGMHRVLSSTEVYGGPGTIGVTFTTTKFHDANPRLFRVYLDSLRQAIDAINADRRRAAAAYLEMSKDRIEPAELERLLDRPEMVFEIVPHGTMRVAEFMARTGSIKAKPESWKDLFFPEIHDLPGD
jgi:NitT/TauT family transport system substrate-binding protein